MIEYRAILTNVSNLERVQQSISFNFNSIANWTEEILKRYPTGAVEIYQNEEKFLAKRYGPKFERRAICNCGCAREAHTNITSTSEANRYGACRNCDCKNFQEKEQ